MDKYKLTFEGSENPMRISLNPKTGKEFLKALDAENQLLRKHIRDNCDLVKAPYLLRELVVHREGLHATQIEDNGWKANLVRVHRDFVECLQRLGDTNNTFVQVSDFGVYSGFLLSPYIFSKEIAKIMFPFCDRFLELMGYQNFVEQQPKGFPYLFRICLTGLKRITWDFSLHLL
jgi:hypothetical protein